LDGAEKSVLALLRHDRGPEVLTSLAASNGEAANHK
jgi:hypothetical protein